MLMLKVLDLRQKSCAWVSPGLLPAISGGRQCLTSKPQAVSLRSGQNLEGKNSILA